MGQQQQQQHRTEQINAYLFNTCLLKVKSTKTIPLQEIKQNNNKDPKNPYKHKHQIHIFKELVPSGLPLLKNII